MRLARNVPLYLLSGSVLINLEKLTVAWVDKNEDGKFALKYRVDNDTTIYHMVFDTAKRAQEELAKMMASTTTPIIEEDP